MKLKIVIDMDNAAFGETPEERNAEVCRILCDYANKVARDYIFNCAMYDSNGNVVGAATTDNMSELQK